MVACRMCGRVPKGPADPGMAGRGRGAYDVVVPEWDTAKTDREGEAVVALRSGSRAVLWPEGDVCPECYEGGQ